jgi:hypothetical protein
MKAPTKIVLALGIAGVMIGAAALRFSGATEDACSAERDALAEMQGPNDFQISEYWECLDAAAQSGETP